MVVCVCFKKGRWGYGFVICKRELGWSIEFGVFFIKISLRFFSKKMIMNFKIVVIRF